MVGACNPTGESSLQFEKGLLVNVVQTVPNHGREVEEVGVEVSIGGIHIEDMGMCIGGGGVGNSTKQGDYGESGENLCYGCLEEVVTQRIYLELPTTTSREWHFLKEWVLPTAPCVR